ncbi:hypothetical protein PAL_GLEAN10007780 [Pteropus alecto]|uniref:Uncharacterized protein n=1 Tax=Pteropus alecto TaxID=9402 RepID=L5KH76_PTEAL|nr:hypothetical protein PAL_GLEAN10007780 [Pteropus alecto]
MCRHGDRGSEVTSPSLLESRAEQGLPSPPHPGGPGGKGRCRPLLDSVSLKSPLSWAHTFPPARPGSRVVSPDTALRGPRAASQGHSFSASRACFRKGRRPCRHRGATTWACVAHPASCVLSTANEAHGGEAEGRIEGRRWREDGGLSAGRGPPGAARWPPGPRPALGQTRRLRAAGTPPSAVSRLWAGKGPSSWQFPPKPRTPHAPPGFRATAAPEPLRGGATISPSCSHGDDHTCPLPHSSGPHGVRRWVGVWAHRAITGAILGGLPSQPQLRVGCMARRVSSTRHPNTSSWSCSAPCLQPRCQRRQ